MLLLRQLTFILPDPLQISEASLYINDKQKAPAQRIAEKVLFIRLLKNPQMRGPRDPESGVATNKERHLATPTSW